MKIVLATNNPHKVGELTDLLSGEGREIRTLRESGFTGDIVEDGATFEENSYIKARTVSERLGCIAVADDSGLEVDCLGGAPGVYSARYAGEHATDGENIDKLLAAVRGKSDRRARFVSVIRRLSRRPPHHRARRMRGPDSRRAPRQRLLRLRPGVLLRAAGQDVRRDDGGGKKRRQPPGNRGQTVCGNVFS